jgi:hypothetical protein
MSGLLRRVFSAARGALWLVRGGGLRERVEDLERQARDVKAGLADAWRGLGAQLAIIDARLAETRELAARRLLQMDQDLQWARGRLAASGPVLPPDDLRNFEKRVSSQNGEDGILEEIFRRVGTTNRYFVEIGAESGAECNCARLAADGWHGLFLEADAGHFARLHERYAGRPGVRCARATVSAANVEAILAEHRAPADFDLLSIDIDGNDYWVWAAIRGWRPRVVVIEYNASHPPAARRVMKEDPGRRWDGTTYYGASLASLAALGRQKGYALVGTNSTGVNAFFVRDELVAPGRFLDPAVCYHYSPPTHGPYPGGHPLGDGPWVEA